MKRINRDTSHLKREVCQTVNGLTLVHYRDQTLEEANRICQNMNDEAGAHIPSYFVRIQRRGK